MKTILTAIAVAVFVVFPSLCFASYVIHLKSGHSFQTDRYWEEGGEIKFKRYGGVVGVRKDLVQEIEEIEDLPEDKDTIAEKETPETVKKPEETDKEGEGAEKWKGDKEGKTAAAEKKPKTEKPPASAPPAETQGDKKQKNIIEKEFDLLKERVDSLEFMSEEELYQFDKDLTLLRNKILKAGLGGVYDNQLVEILSMGSRVEEVLKQRGQ